jgi:hypothetical protein
MASLRISSSPMAEGETRSRRLMANSKRSPSDNCITAAIRFEEAFMGKG